ncbi:MAG: OB-fold nucleic acid binding domain-containing protein [Nanoarchaeota archaeon]
MNEQNSNQGFKRKVAYKFKIGDVLAGRVIFDGERIKHIDIHGKEAVRVNIIANVVEKYIQEGEKKYGSITLDDATGQIKIKTFGEDVLKFDELSQGDTVLVVGLLRSWNNEVYITPEIIKKKEPTYLLIRKYEVELEQPKIIDREKIAELKDKILGMVKEKDSTGGLDIDRIILDLKEPPEIINREVKRLLEDGVVYEPRPGKLRYLGN